jgi:NADH dehydrogenase
MMWSKTKAAVCVGVGGAAAWQAWKAVERRARPPLAPRQKIVIIGAGFGGMAAARTLADLLPAGDDADIVLVDRNDFLLFTPMLTEVAGGELDARHIVASPRQLSPRIRFEQATVERIDLTTRSVVLQSPIDGSRTTTLTADSLVIALGAAANYHHIPGVQEHSVSIKTLRDAVGVRNRIMRCLEAAHVEADADVRKQLLTFVVAGGGFTGVETMAALNDLARSAARMFDTIRPSDITTVIVEPDSRLLQEVSAQLAYDAQEKLEQHGVRVMLNTKITSADAAGVSIDPGGRIAARTLVWAGGVRPNPLVETLNCQRGPHGGIVVEPSCAVAGHTGVWALGDCAEIPKPQSKGTYAPTAQNASREGALVGRNIVATLRGQPQQPFTFEPIGEVALVGRHAGVATLYGYRFSGLAAWAMWRAIYVAKMPAPAQRYRIVLDWMLDAIFGRPVAEVPFAPPAPLSGFFVHSPASQTEGS